jgi:TldD protein
MLLGYIKRRLGVFLLFVLPAFAVRAQDSLITVLEAELARSFTELKKATVPAYYIDYRVDDVANLHLNTSFGSLVRAGSDKSRVLVSRVKVGSYEFDNTHPQGPDDFEMHEGSDPTELPYENEKIALRMGIWMTTQNEYKQALRGFKAARQARERTTTPVTTAPTNDFSKETPTRYYEPPQADLITAFNGGVWKEKLKKYSALFLKNGDLVEGDVSLQFSQERKYFITTEQTQVVQNNTSAYIHVNGSIRASDGDVIPLHLSYYAVTPDGFPADEKIMADIEKMIASLEKLKTAPLAEPYSGPAILLAPAAGVFFHEIFGHRVEGHRMKKEYDGHTFKAKIGEYVLPKTLQVYFDPTLTAIDGKPINGGYKYDDEGIKGERVTVVDKGMLKTFLMSRTPLENLARSNGHGRASIGMEPVSRQSNLIVETTKGVPMEDLRKMLLKECKRQGKPYGYLFRDVVGGFTVTDRYNPNAFNIFPTMVYRIYVDGRADELVRGVDLIGTPLAMFAEIQATGNDRDTFIGFCGAESGYVPVSAASPSLFVRRIETQKKPRQHQEATLLSRPGSQPQP